MKQTIKSARPQAHQVFPHDGLVRMFAHREQRIPTRPFRLLQHYRCNLIHSIFQDTVSTLRTKSASSAGVEQSQKVVNFGGGGHCRTWIAGGVFLTNGDGRGNAGNLIDSGLFHAIQKLTSIGGKRFHIAPLAFGVDSIEHQRRFSRSGNAGDHGKFVVRQRKRQVFKVVNLRTTNDNRFFQGDTFIIRDGRMIASNLGVLVPEDENVRRNRLPNKGKFGQPGQTTQHWAAIVGQGLLPACPLTEIRK